MKARWFSRGLFYILFSTFFCLSCGKDNDSNDNSGGNNNPPPAANEKVVSISNMSFGASSLTVKAGTTVIWINDDNMSHTVTADDGTFHSGTLQTGKSFQYKFSTAGTYPYHCNLHSGMRASVIVN